VRPLSQQLLAGKTQTRTLDEQDAKVSIAKPAGAAADCPIASRSLLRQDHLRLEDSHRAEDHPCQDGAHQGASNVSQPARGCPNRTARKNEDLNDAANDVAALKEYDSCQLLSAPLAQRQFATIPNVSATRHE
jgi:hypothetical protein